MIDTTFENLTPTEKRECLKSVTQFLKNENKIKQKLLKKYKIMFDNMVAFLSISEDKEQGLFYIENFLNKNFKNNDLKNTLYEMLVYDIMKL